MAPGTDRISSATTGMMGDCTACMRAGWRKGLPLPSVRISFMFPEDWLGFTGIAAQNWGKRMATKRHPPSVAISLGGRAKEHKNDGVGTRTSNLPQFFSLLVARFLGHIRHELPKHESVNDRPRPIKELFRVFLCRNDEVRRQIGSPSRRF